MSIFSWLNTGSAAAQTVLTGAVKGLDMLVYTDEEKAVAHAKLVDQWVDLQKSLGEETTVRAVTRRILAVVIVVPFVLLVLAAATLYPFMPEYSKFLLELAQGQFGYLTIGVATFYFGPYMVGKAMGK